MPSIVAVYSNYNWNSKGLRLNTGLIDVCFNCSHDSFDTDRSTVLERAAQAGVTSMISPGSDLSDSAKSLTLSEQYPNLYTSVGIHPHNAKTWTERSYQELKRLSIHNKTLAIGETGLDYNRNFSPPNKQRDVFEQQIHLAIETKLPLFMHQRDAHDDFIELLKPLRNRVGNAVVHCFTGDERMLYDYLDLDLYIGITGWICDERRGNHLNNLIDKIPLQRLLVETDAPYLLPRNLEPAPKGRRNEPAFLPHIVEQIATSSKNDFTTIATMSSTNAKQFFSLDT